MSTQSEQDALEAEIKRVKAYFPFRIVWGYVENGEPHVFANVTRRQMNDAIRAGKQVFGIESK